MNIEISEYFERNGQLVAIEADEFLCSGASTCDVVELRKHVVHNHQTVSECDWDTYAEMSLLA